MQKKMSFAFLAEIMFKQLAHFFLFCGYLMFILYNSGQCTSIDIFIYFELF